MEESERLGLLRWESIGRQKDAASRKWVPMEKPHGGKCLEWMITQMLPRMLPIPRAIAIQELRQDGMKFFPPPKVEVILEPNEELLV